jgi:jumonji domain-containing protein 7
MMTTEQVPRVTSIGRDEFRRTYFRHQRPVVLSSEHSWKPPGWTPADLVALVGDNRVRVATCSNSVFHYGPSAARNLEVREMTMREAAAGICASDGQRAMYLMQQPIVEVFPELCAEISPPDLLGEPAAPHLWFGTAGNVTQLHYDPLSNYFAQVYGRKQFTLYPPQCFDELYPHPVESAFSHLSQIDIEHPDLSRHPRAHGLPRVEVILGPGDMLFLPAFWWHHVRSIDTAISLNFWTVPPVSHCLVPAGLRLLRFAYEQNRLAAIGSPFRDAQTGFLGPAREIAAAGMRWPAVLLAAAVIELTVRRLCDHAGIATDDPGGLRPLAALNLELTRAGHYGAERARLIASLDLIFERARDAREELVTDAETAWVITTVEQLIAGAD